jgi:hypothetical protein
MINGTESLISISSNTSNLMGRRRARSQVMFMGDDLNSLNEQNKQLVQDLIFLKKVNFLSKYEVNYLRY